MSYLNCIYERNFEKNTEKIVAKMEVSGHARKRICNGKIIGANFEQ